ncbi:putative transcriptional regulator [Carbonactinospora thermoautotrophica]|nr:metalloregulator ArsR/SmtB family transcription factor [Carbonactinospora thermoautotrophica]KWW98606.1 putative transcriptional regulator [Carbonactinospora thermoautotrophica]
MTEIVERPATQETCASTGLPEPMPRQEAERLARLFKAVADPTRLQLLSMIQGSPTGEACVCDLTEPFGLTQPTISHHLKILIDAGLLRREKRAIWSWYSITPEHHDTLRRLLP